MKRRTLLASGAVAGVAAAAGVAVALRSSRRKIEVDGDGAATAIDPWKLVFTRVDGTTMPMASLRGKPLLLNFWATWCAPCATEMPLLDGFARSAGRQGWNVLALAIDSRDPVQRFLTEHGLSLPVALAGAEGLDLSRSLGNNLGGLPFTATFDAGGAVSQRKLGALDAALLDSWLQRPH